MLLGYAIKEPTGRGYLRFADYFQKLLTDSLSQTAMPQIIFVNRFFYPDHSASSQMLSAVAIGLTKVGFKVTVVSSSMIYDQPSVALPGRDIVGGVEIFRVATTRFGRVGLIGRSIDYLSFYFSSFFMVLEIAKAGDILVVKTDPPLLSVPLGLAARLRRLMLVNWLQDVFPETAQRLGLKMTGGIVGGAFTYLRNRSLKTAERNVVIGECMAQYVLSLGTPSTSIVEIANFCDDQAIQPIPWNENPLRTLWGFEPSDFVIGYSGNLGRAHDIQTVLDAAELLRDAPNVKFLFIGGGHFRNFLEAEAVRRKLSNIVAKPYQPLAELTRSLCVPDVHWVSLLPQLEGLILPSKLYGIAASGRALLMVGDPQGEIGNIVRRHGIGIVIQMGNSKAFAETILQLMDSPGHVAEMGNNARNYIDLYATRNRAIQAWAVMLKSLLPGS